MKRCLRCREQQPISAFAFGGRCHFCDVCRWDGLTDAERAVASRASKSAWRWRNIERVRAYDREYQRRRVA